MKIEKDREDDTFSWALTRLQFRGVTSYEQGRAQETQKFNSELRLIFINRQSLP